MRILIALSAAFTIIVTGLAVPACAAFDKATIQQIVQVRDSAGAVTGIRVSLRVTDTVLPGLFMDFDYLVTGNEFISLPGGATAKKLALVAILKREVKREHAAWIASKAARPLAPIIRDALTDLGITELTDLNNPAPNLP